MNFSAPGDAKNGIVDFCRPTDYRVENRFFQVEDFQKRLSPASDILLKTQRIMSYTVKTHFRPSMGRPRSADIKKSKAGAKGSRGKRNYQNRPTGREVDVNGAHGIAGGHLGHVGS